ncbi:hypothetical protein WA026_018978 [Henosepilachna vigintioctopunctata]|uniref:Uncharacterized protein n=1 Tax=Henosepilachna vigintioctopunctata TaxID=420089 RepID=A0AAW1UQ79_9CUCU
MELQHQDYCYCIPELTGKIINSIGIIDSPSKRISDRWFSGVPIRQRVPYRHTHAPAAYRPGRIGGHDLPHGGALLRPAAALTAITLTTSRRGTRPRRYLVPGNEKTERSSL